jgi:LuxR family maltose regulon positive regulatory protein
LARQALDNLPEASFARGLAALVLGSASRFDGDLAESTEAFVEARMASMAAGNSYMAVTGTCQLAYTEMLAGQLRKAAQSCREALQMAEGAEGRYLPVAGYALVYLGMAFCEWDNLQAAVRHSIQGIDLCKQVGYVVDQLVGYSTLARAHQAAGDWESAGSACQSAEQLSLRIKGSVYARRWAEECQIRLWSAQGKVSEIARWIEDTDLRTDDEIGFARELEPVILARALVAVGREQGGEPYLDDALDLLARLLEMAESRRWMGKVIEILVLQALAHEFRGETGEALGALQRAMSFAEPEGYVRTFVDEGPAMRRLLTEAVERGIEPDYARRLLTGFEETTADEGRRAEEPLEA